MCFSPRELGDAAASGATSPGGGARERTRIARLRRGKSPARPGVLRAGARPDPRFDPFDPPAPAPRAFEPRAARFRTGGGPERAGSARGSSGRRAAGDLKLSR